MRDCDTEELAEVHEKKVQDSPRQTPVCRTVQYCLFIRHLVVTKVENPTISVTVICTNLSTTMLRSTARTALRRFGAVRRLATQPNAKVAGETVTETVTTTDATGTFTVQKTITSIRESWSKMSPVKKGLTCAYFSIATGCMMKDTYDDGKQELDNHRKDKNAWRTEFQAVKDGCSKNTYRNFTSSLFWPYSIYQKLVPSIVLALNPPPPPKPVAEK